MIYQYIAESNTAQLKGRNVTDNSGLIAVGDRLCDEYFPILLLHAGKIEATVTNFNFQNIVTFINRLSTAELTTISTTTKPTDRAMEIVLRVTECPSPNVDLMERWYAKQLVKGSPSDLRQCVSFSGSDVSQTLEHSSQPRRNSQSLGDAYLSNLTYVSDGC